MDKYEERIEQLQKNEDKLMKEKGQVLEEKLRAGKAATQADQIIKNLQAQMRTIEVKHQQDLEIKTNMLRNLEEENLASKVHCDEANARLASLKLETSELHSAMASLHGEISAQQREIDEAKERDQRAARQKKELSVRLDEKEAELVRFRNERRNLEAKLTEAEKKVADAAMRDEQILQEGKSQVEHLVRERDTVQGSLAKLSHKLRQQTDTSKELNSALNRMRIELSNAQEDCARERARAECAVRDVQSLQILVTSLERSKTEADTLAQRAEQDKMGTLADLTIANEKNVAAQAEQRKLLANVEKLDRQRTELTVELSCKSKDLDALKKTHDAMLIDLEEARAKQDMERIAKERALEKTGTLEADLERARNDIREHIENGESLARQLRESERMREQAVETSRAQQRENANRIIEFSQKNARLASELSAKEDEIAGLKRSREDAQNKGSESGKERDDLKNQYLATRVRLQALEDEHEVIVAKLESSKAESEELRVQMRQEVKQREQHLQELLIRHDEAIHALNARLESEAEEKLQVADATRKQAEERLNRALLKEKDVQKQQQAEWEAQRGQEAEVQRARLATLAKAMEGLQVELREESAKSTSLAQELAVLKDLAEVGNGEMQERVNYVERERTRERARLEGQLADVKEQLRQQVEQKQQRDQLMSTIEQQLTREREAKFTALQRVRAAEDEAATLASQVDTLTEETNNQRKELRGFERKLALAIQNKDSEIVRLTRRNEVLGEAVTRLTAAQGTGTVSTTSTPSAFLNKFFTAGVSLTSPSDDIVTDRSHASPSTADEEGKGILPLVGLLALPTAVPVPVKADLEMETECGSFTSRIEEVVSQHRRLLAHEECNDPMVVASTSFLSRAISSAPVARTLFLPAANVPFEASNSSPMPTKRVGSAPAEVGVGAASCTLDGTSPPTVPDSVGDKLVTPVTIKASVRSTEDANSGVFDVGLYYSRPDVLVVTPDEQSAQQQLGSPLALAAALVTPNATSPSETNGDSSGKFIDRLKLSVEKGKGIQLPFSPKRTKDCGPPVPIVGTGSRAKSAPAGRPPAHVEACAVSLTQGVGIGENKGKENEHPVGGAAGSLGGTPHENKVSSSDRIKRAAQFMKTRSSQSAVPARKPPVF